MTIFATQNWWKKNVQALFTQRGYESADLTELAKKMELEGCSAVANGDLAGPTGATLKDGAKCWNGWIF